MMLSLLRSMGNKLVKTIFKSVTGPHFGKVENPAEAFSEYTPYLYQPNVKNRNESGASRTTGWYFLQNDQRALPKICSECTGLACCRAATEQGKTKATKEYATRETRDLYRDLFGKKKKRAAKGK